MIRYIRQIILHASSVAMLGTLAAWGISPEELQRELAEKTALTVIDVRSLEHFKQGHVHSAINIPASLIPEKTLPRLGRVVVYGDGFGDAEVKAMVALNAKPGIKAELLDGGYSAWLAAQGTTTGNRGLNPEKIEYVTYQQLQDTTSNVVIVDLRKEEKQEKRLGAASVKSSSDEATGLTDLSKAFPGKQITRTPHREQQLSARSVGASNKPILVLIDNGDGTAQQTARELRAQGNPRVVILAGGETTVARQGARGLQRTGQNLENFNNAIKAGSN